MDNWRGQFADQQGTGPLAESHDEATSAPPRAKIGHDERRMHVRAYNFWAGLLGSSHLPRIDELHPAQLTDFGPNSVLLDFTGGIDNPRIGYIGEALARECGAFGPIHTLADVPDRSLLSRMTAHYMQILANAAPIGFDAEFVNQREVTILYRGIMLPFTSDGSTIDYVYGVINWKELAEDRADDALPRQVDATGEPRTAARIERAPLTEWADGPAALDVDFSDLGLTVALPEPHFGMDLDRDEGAELPAAYLPTPPSRRLGDWLASAREAARAAITGEERSRQALYAAIGRAYDFFLAAAAHPQAFRTLVAEAGLSLHDRAPLTPVVKLVFGAEYDKTRLAEFATVIAHAQRVGLRAGELADYLAGTPGGLKGLVAEERGFRRGADRGPRFASVAERLADRLRTLDPSPLDALPEAGSEFTVLIARRLPGGGVALLGEVADDALLLGRAARRLLG